MEENQIQKLIDNCKKGDTTAFEALFIEFQPIIFRFAFRLLCNEDDAKDIVQESFIKIWTNLDKYNAKYRFSTWLYKIAGNLCYDRLRSVKYISREADIPATFDSSLRAVSSENIETNIANKDLKRIIMCLTNDLTPKQKLVFTLIDIEGLESHEVEKITSLSAEKIKSNLYLARKYMKDKLKIII